MNETPANPLGLRVFKLAIACVVLVNLVLVAAFLVIPALENKRGNPSATPLVQTNSTPSSPEHQHSQKGASNNNRAIFERKEQTPKP